jgi:hypothetical protein
MGLSGEGTTGSLADLLIAVQVGDTPNIVESRTAQGFSQHEPILNRTLLIKHLISKPLE